MSAFARFMGMSREGLSKRLSGRETRKNSLYFQFLLFLDEKATQFLRGARKIRVRVRQPVERVEIGAVPPGMVEDMLANEKQFWEG